MEKNGKLLTDAKFNEVSYYYSDGLIGVSENCVKDGIICLGGWYFIDKQGNTVINGPYEDVSIFSEGVCWVKDEGNWGLIDVEGNWIINPQLKKMPSGFQYGISQCKMDVDVGAFLPERYYFYIDKLGNIIWEP